MKESHQSKLLKKALLPVLIGFFCLNLAWKLSLAASYAPDLGGFERNVIWGIQRIMDGSALYSNPDAVPFSMIQYMPLYYYLTAFAGTLLGIAPEDAHSVYQLARTLNLLLGFSLSGLVFFMLRFRFQCKPETAVGFALLVFLMLPAFTISGRPDTLKTWFFILQLALLGHYSEIRLRYLIPLSLGLSFLCFMSKQDGITAFGLLPLAFLMGREWRNILVYMFLAGVFLFLVLGVGNHLLKGVFFSNVFGALQNGISFSWFKSVFLNFFGQHALLFAPALVLSLEFAREKSRLFRMLAAGFLLALFPPLAAALKFGSGPNYFLEAQIISCLLIAIAFRASPGKLIFRFAGSRPLLWLVLLLLWFSVPSLEWVSGIFLNQEKQLALHYQKDKIIAENLRSSYPENDFMLLNGRQWEDQLSTQLWDRLINPNRDVSEQVFRGSGGAALASLRKFIAQKDKTVLITTAGEKPVFEGLDFSGYREDRKFGSYQTWVKNP